MTLISKLKIQQDKVWHQLPIYKPLRSKFIFVCCKIINMDPVNISSLPTGKMLSFVGRGCWEDPGGERRVSPPGSPLGFCNALIQWIPTIVFWPHCWRDNWDSPFYQESKPEAILQSLEKLQRLPPKTLESKQGWWALTSHLHSPLWPMQKIDGSWKITRDDQTHTLTR